MYNLLQKLEQGTQKFQQDWPETEGEDSDTWEEDIESGFWYQLAEQNLVCTLCVLCPPANDMAAMFDNEERLKYLIGQLSGHMHQFIIAVRTSRPEIGTDSTTFVYVRFPYHMWAEVQ